MGRTLSYRGVARAYLGDANGIADMERALELLLERGAAQDAAVVRNNLPIVRYLLYGPAEALDGFEQGIAFCRERGLDHAAMVCETNCPGLLVEIGRPHEALELARRVTSTAEVMGDTYDLVELHSVEMAAAVAFGTPVSGDEAEALVRSARAAGGLDPIVLGLSAAATALVNDAPSEACALLQELAETGGARETTYYRRQLPAMVRTVLRANDEELAARILEGLDRRYPVDEHGLCASRAQLAEAAGDQTRAASLYTDAAQRWHQFGNQPEHAYALLGQGRCLTTLANPDAEQPLRQARELFKSMGYKPALAETDALLPQTAAAAS